MYICTTSAQTFRFMLYVLGLDLGLAIYVLDSSTANVNVCVSITKCNPSWCKPDRMQGIVYHAA